MIKICQILVLVSCILASNSTGQTTFNVLDSAGFAFGQVEETSFGYLLVGADYNESGSGTVVLAKFDAFGQSLQVDTLSPDSTVSTNGVAVLFGGSDFFLFNSVNPGLPYVSQNDDLQLSRLNDDLSIVWTAQFGGNMQELPFPGSLVLFDQSLLLLSSTQSYGAGSADLYLIKTDTSGNLLWEQTYGSTSPEVSRNLNCTKEGNYILSGLKRYVSPNWNILLIKVDTSGNVLWEVDYGIPENDYGAVLTPLHDHTFLVYHNSNDGVGGTTTGYIDKVDGNGELIWQKTYPYLNFSSFSWGKPIENDDGTIMLNCIVKNSQGIPIHRLLKITPLGDTLWTKTYYTRDDLDQYIYDIKPTADSGYIMGGSAFPVDTNIQRAWLIKTDCNGADGVMYPTGAPCDQYDCSLYPIDASFVPSETIVDLAQGGQVTFTNSSSNTTSRVWNFGDGDWDYTDSVMTHTFTDTGWYNVSLIVFHGTCSDTMVVPIHVINTVGIDAYANIGHGLKVFPNPSNGTFNLSFDHPAKGVCYVVNMLGEIQGQILINEDQGQYKVENLSKGFYILRINYDHGGNESVRVVIE